MNMKTTKYLLGLVVAIMAMLTSCNKDNEGAIYNSDNGAVSFTSTNLGSVTVLPNDPAFEVEIVRGNTSNDLTGKISVEALLGKTPLEGVTVSDYSFKAGENKTTIKVDVTPLEIGDVLTVNLKIDDSQVRQVGFRVDHRRNYQSNAGDDGAETVRENMLEHDSQIAGAERSCRKNILLIFKAVELHTRPARHTYPPRCKERDEENKRLA